ncbi:MAG TPA: hypothetical protein VKR27_02650, partial [Acidimicrobiales bacterium]|nr:hypothetical protein [Acidimicrobiales bacterium]
IHLRVWDRLPRGGGRLYFETSVATVALNEALSRVWASGAPASGTVVDAERARIAAAIVAEASQWGADAISYRAHSASVSDTRCLARS